MEIIPKIRLYPEIIDRNNKDINIIGISGIIGRMQLSLLLCTRVLMFERPLG
jgi:hypothetical protein